MPAQKNEKRKITGSIWKTEKCMYEEFGIEEPDPFNTDLDTLAEVYAEMRNAFARKYPDLCPEGPVHKPVYSIPQYDGRTVCSVAYGAQRPVWDGRTRSYWHDRSYVPWAWVETVKDVSSIKVPDWSSIPMVQENIKKYEEVRSKTKYTLEANTRIQWSELRFTHPYTKKSYAFNTTMSFVDLGAFLFGDTRFLETSLSDVDLTKALMEKCFEVTVSYRDYVNKMYGLKVKGMASFGGDYSFMFSPDMYREYAMAYDAMRVERYGDLPCNLHSCGASSHLYEIWGTYPNKDNIVLMQTRGIEGKLKELRSSLPNTFLQITIHQPQFDFEEESVENIVKLVWHYAEEAGFKDLHLTVIVSKTNDDVERNIRAFYKVIDEVNEHALSQ